MEQSSKKQKFIDKFLGLSLKVQSNPYIQAISNGFASLMPLIIVGSLLSVVNSLGIQAYQDFLVNAGIKEFLQFPNLVTNGMLSIYVVFSISYNLARNLKLDEFMSGMISIMAFMLLQPFTLSESGSFSIDTNLLGAEGIFTAIVVALIVVSCMKFLVKHKIYIKMPAGVPEMVERSFKALTTVAFVSILFLIIKIVFAMTSFETFPNLIAIIIQTPLKALGSNFISFLILMMIVNILWFFGIHGHLVALSVMLPVYIQMDLENLVASEAGRAMPNILGQSFVYVYAPGMCVLAGFIYWLWKSKVKRYNAVAKLSLIPAIFGIGEPLAFGVPYVYNFVLFIPVVFNGIVNYILAYAGTMLGLLPRLNGVSINGMPVVVSGFLTGGFSVAIFQLLMILLSILIWKPFVNKLCKMEEEKEKAMVAQE